MLVGKKKPNEKEGGGDDDDGCLLDLSTGGASLWGPNGTPGLLDPTLLRHPHHLHRSVLDRDAMNPTTPTPPLARHITTLDLRRCNLKRLPEALDPVGRSLLCQLKTLLLRGNSLKGVPAGWLGGGGGGGGDGGGDVKEDEGCAWTSSLEHVDLRLNKLDTLPHAVAWTLFYSFIHSFTLVHYVV